MEVQIQATQIDFQKEVLETLKRVEMKMDSFEGFYIPEKEEVKEIKEIEKEIEKGEFCSLNKLLEENDIKNV
jgi:hypothetical protein